MRWTIKLNITGDDDRESLTGNELFYAQRCANVLKRYNDSYDDISNARREAGKKGAQSRWSDGKIMANDGKNGKAILPYSKNGNTNTNTNTNTEANTDAETKTDSSPTTVGGTRKTRPSAFVPPGYDEVADYCRERGNRVDAQSFVDFYTAKGWMVGKNRMKDWRAAVRNWERSDDGGRGRGLSSAVDAAPRDDTKTLEQMERLRAKMNGGSADG
jgi:hypothetical protein